MRAASLCFVLVACGDNRGLTDAAVRDEVALFPAEATTDVDMLFVLQKSCCVLDKQTRLKNAFAQLVADLDSLPGGRPNLHIGVVTSDLGTSSMNDPVPAAPIGNGPGSCAGTGDAGALQKGTDVENTLVDGAFIVDRKNADGSRTTNVAPGTSLATAFSALASVGASGCGLEQHLRAASVALANPVNAGFRRDDAALAIVFLAEDEDCSAASTQLFGDDPAFGNLGFRCFGYGVTCDDGGATPDEMRIPGLKSQCHSNDASPLIAPVSQLVDSIATHVTDSRQLLLAVIAGDPTPVEIGLSTPPGGGVAMPAVRASCSTSTPSGISIAEPAVRLVEAAASVRRHVFASSCSTDYSGPSSAIARQVRGLVGDTCLREDIALPGDCEVLDEHADGSLTTIVQCSSTSTYGCYELVSDPSCLTTQKLRVEVRRTAPAIPGTMVSVRCTRQ